MVIWSDPAIEDLKSAFDYIVMDSKFYAERLVEIAIEKSELINKFPNMGRVVPEQKSKNVREVFIYSYRMMYQITNSDIEIIAFIHGARDLSSEEFQNLIQ